MQLRLQDVAAKCEKCGGIDFDALDARDSGTQAVLTCAGCGAPTTRLILLMQIGDETVQRARKFLTNSKRRREDRNKPK